MKLSLFLVAALPAYAAAQALSCLPEQRLGCGCAIKLEGAACGRDYAQVHLFSDSEGAPLWLNIDGRETAVPSVLEPTRSFSHVRGDRWVDTYRGPDIVVRVTYRPGRNTCPKEPAEEDCEYFDVEASVLIQSHNQTSKYRGTGTCGC